MGWLCLLLHWGLWKRMLAYEVGENLWIVFKIHTLNLTNLMLEEEKHDNSRKYSLGKLINYHHL